MTEAARLREALKRTTSALAQMPDAGLAEGDPRYRWWYDEAAPALAEAREALAAVPSDEADYDAFIEGLTAKLNAAGVPAMPSWPDAIDWLIERAQSAQTLREIIDQLLSVADLPFRERVAIRKEVAATSTRRPHEC